MRACVRACVCVCVWLCAIVCDYVRKCAPTTVMLRFAVRHSRAPKRPHIPAPLNPLPGGGAHHGVWVVDVNVVVLPAGGLLHKRLVDALAVELHIVLLRVEAVCVCVCVCVCARARVCVLCVGGRHCKPESDRG